jgi:hypothetical protein
MKLQPGTFCPLVKKDCVQMKCAWFVQLRGTNPNTGQEVDEWGCAVSWLPMLLIENAKESRHTGAAVESFRNEMVNANQVTQHLAHIAATGGAVAKLIEGH